MFVSLQLGTGTPAPIATIIGGDVAVVFSAATCSFFDDSMLAGALQSLPRVAERRQATWSCKAAVKVAVTAQRSGGYVPSTGAARPRASGSSGDALRLANGTRSSLVAAGKKMRM